MNIKKKVKDIIKENIFPALWSRCLPRYQKMPEWHFYQNINLDTLNPKQPHILISYIMAPFLASEKAVRHTNMREALVIVRNFIQAGYAIDIADCQSKFMLPLLQNKRYDVIFGFGIPFMQACKLNPQARKVIYLTECAPDFSLSQESNRLKYYAERHGVRFPLERSGKYYQNEQIDIASESLFMGNDYTSRAYHERFPHLKILLCPPTGMYNENFTLEHRTEEPKCGFLWFGSNGAIHKGLDILLDVFKDIPQADLYICGLSENDAVVLKAYQRYTNIHNCHFVQVDSDDYLALIDKVSYCVLPSASEGMSTSVLTCMRHGILPVVTRSTGIDVYDFGWYIEDYHVEQVEKLIRSLMHISDAELDRRRFAVYQYANQEFSLDAYNMRIKKWIESLHVDSQ